MPTGIDQNLIPQLIRNSVDPELLNCAQSIEWSIDRNCGRNEHGYLESSSPAIATELAMNDNTMTSSLRTSSSARKSRRLEWADSPSSGGRDSGFDMTPTSPYKPNQQRRIDLSPLDESMAFDEQYGSLKPGQYSAHPTGDVVFEAAPRARAGERTVHYEKVSRIVGEQELQAMGLDPNNYSGGMPMISGTMDDSLYRSSSGFDTNASFFGERQRARSLSPTGDSSLDDQRKKTVIFGSMEEIDTREQEYFPYRDAHQGKVSRFAIMLLPYSNTPLTLTLAPAAAWRQRIRNMGKPLRRQASMEAVQRPMGARQRAQTQACAQGARATANARANSETRQS